MRFANSITLIFVTFILLSASQGNPILPNLYRIVSPYKWNLVTWHLNNLPKKWVQDPINTDSIVSPQESWSHTPRSDNELKQDVEEIIEEAISLVLSNEGLDSQIGIIFPPVDTSFGHPPKVLILSPRENIEVKQAILLKNNISIKI